jgi:hypothetical protein
VTTYIVTCAGCGKSFTLAMRHFPDLVRHLDAMTNCPAGSHITLPSLLHYVVLGDVKKKENNEEKEFQELDTFSGSDVRSS